MWAESQVNDDVMINQSHEFHYVPPSDEDSLRSTVVSGQVGESSFEGCIRNVYLSTSRTGPLERDLALATSSSGVTFHTCNP